MTVIHVAASSVALTFGLVLASALMAAVGEDPTPSAQMNRHLYDHRQPAPAGTAADAGARAGVPRVYVPQGTPAYPVPASEPAAQMNRHLYRKQ